jgi:hypothetical protein
LVDLSDSSNKFRLPALRRQDPGQKKQIACLHRFDKAVTVCWQSSLTFRPVNKPMSKRFQMVEFKGSTQEKTKPDVRDPKPEVSCLGPAVAGKIK